MPGQIDANYSANFQKFVDFANKAYAPNGKGEDTVARFSGMPVGDYKGTFASFMRTAEMKTANDQVRDLFRKTIADMFGGEKFIPDIVRDNMKLEDFNKGKPLTARRINLVKIAIDTLGGGKFTDPASIGKATAMGYVASELPKLARVANIYQQVTGCTDAEAESAALDPNSKARRLYDCGGRFTQNVENFKKGLALMDKFAGWFKSLHDDYAAGKLDTPTKRSFKAGVCNRDSAVPALKFLMEEIAVNSKIPLEAENPEDVFGMKNNPAMRFIGRNYTISFANSLAQIPPEKRTVLYAVFDALHKLPSGNNMPDKKLEIDQSISAVLGARVMKNFDAVAALQKSGKLDRARLVPLLFPDLQVPANAPNKEIVKAFETKLQSAENFDIILPLHSLAMQSGATLDEAAAAIRSGTGLKNAPGISTANGKLEQLDGTAKGGRDTMLGDLYRPSSPSFASNGEDVLKDEDTKFVFNFPDGTTVAAKKGAEDASDVRDANNAIADKIKDLCGNVHPKQLSNVYFVLSQSGTGGNTRRAFEQYGINSDEHMPLTFTFSRNDETGAVTIKYSEPKGFPVKFNWTTTIDLDGNVASTPMRIWEPRKVADAIKEKLKVAEKPDKQAARFRAVDLLVERAKDDADLLYLLGYGKCSFAVGILLTDINELRSDDEIIRRVDAFLDNLNELRTAAKGDERVIKGLMPQFINFRGRAVRQGLITKMFEEAAKLDLGALEKISSASSPKEFAEAMCAVNKAVARLADATDAYVGNKRIGTDDVVGISGLAMGILFARLGDKKLHELKTAFRSENAAKVAQAFERFRSRQFPDGVTSSEKARNAVMQVSLLLYSTWAVRMDALMAIDDMLGTEFDSNAVYTDSIPENEFKDVYDAVEKYLQETNPESLA